MSNQIPQTADRQNFRKYFFDIFPILSGGDRIFQQQLSLCCMYFEIGIFLYRFRIPKYHSLVGFCSLESLNRFIYFCSARYSTHKSTIRFESYDLRPPTNVSSYKLTAWAKCVSTLPLYERRLTAAPHRYRRQTNNSRSSEQAGEIQIPVLFV